MIQLFKSFTLLCWAFLLIVSTSAQAKSFNKGGRDGHEADMYSVMPFARSERITDWMRTIHNSLDHPTSYFPGLRDRPHQQFSWRSYGHRTFFHWGFNSDPRRAEPLRSLVHDCRWSLSVENGFWRKVINEQARRNRNMMQATAKALDFEMSGFRRNYANAFAAIIYDVHILGDYTTTQRAPLQPLDGVVADLRQAIVYQLETGRDGRELIQLIERTTSFSDERRRAEEILYLLSSHLPQILRETRDGYFTRHFAQSGIRLRPLSPPSSHRPQMPPKPAYPAVYPEPHNPSSRSTNGRGRR